MTTLYLVAVAVALLLQFVYPPLALYLVLGLLVWFVASLFVYRLPVMSRTLGATVVTTPGLGRSPAPESAGAPLRSGATPVSGKFLDFCPYCARAVEPGTPVCPDCQHRIPVF